MDSEKNIYSWIVVALIIALFVVDHYSFKRGYEDGKNSQSIQIAENSEKYCENELQDQMYEFCEVPIENYIADNIKEVCNDQDYISMDLCYEKIHEAKDEVKNDSDSQMEIFSTEKEELEEKVDEQQEYIEGYNDYQSCVIRWTDRNGYIKPSDESFCKLYLKH